MNYHFDAQAVSTLYDNIADVYSSYYSNYEEAVRKQGKDLHTVLVEHSAVAPERVLDCSCGIGTQAIGLALQGLEVYGGDISPLSIEKAKLNATHFGVQADFRVMDMRYISNAIDLRFDAILTCGNSIAHLLTEDDIHSFFSSVKQSLNSKGTLIIALTNHEGESRKEGIFYDPHVKQEEHGRTINFQLWKWLEPDLVYRCDDYTLSDYEEPPTIKKVSANFRIWRKAVLTDLAKQHGFDECAWITPEQSGHHNPIFLAQLNV